MTETIQFMHYYSLSFQVYAEATLVFPLIVAQTFAKHHFASKESSEKCDAG